MALGYKNFVKGIGVVPKGTADSNALGDIEVLNTDSKLYFHNGTLSDALVSETVEATLTNKVLTGNEADNLVHSGGGQLTLNSTGVITVPDGTDTLAALTLSQTLTNKTLTSPVLNTPTTDTVTGIAGGPLTITGASTQNVIISATGGAATLSLSAANNASITSSGGNVSITSSNANATLSAGGFGGIATINGPANLNLNSAFGAINANADVNLAGNITPDADNTRLLGSVDNNFVNVHTLKLESNAALNIESGTVLNVTAGQNLNLSAPAGDVSLSASIGGGTSVVSGAGVQLISNTNNILLTANNTIILDTITNPIELQQLGTTVATVDSGLKIKPAQFLTLEGSSSNNIQISNPDTLGSSYNIALPNSAPIANTALVYNGSNYVWGVVSGGYTSSSQLTIPVNGTITLSASEKLQTIEVSGNGAPGSLSSATPFSPTPPDKTSIILIGTSNTNTVTIPSGGIGVVSLNGECTLGLHDTIQLMYVASLNRYIEISRS